MADPDKMAALQKPLEELQNASTEVLAERYGLTPSDLTTTEKVIQNIFKVGDPGWISSKVSGTPPVDALASASAWKQTERRRQGGDQSAEEMIEALKKKERTSYGDK